MQTYDPQTHTLLETVNSRTQDTGFSSQETTASLDEGLHLRHDAAPIISAVSARSACHFPVTSDAGTDTISVPNTPVNFLKTVVTTGYTALRNNANIAVPDVCSVNSTNNAALTSIEVCGAPSSCVKHPCSRITQ